MDFETVNRLPYRNRTVSQTKQRESIVVSIVVPLYNESVSIRPLLNQIDDVLKLETVDHWRAEIILVDDGSVDCTYREACTVAAETSTLVTVLKLRRNFGQTAAMQAGISASSGTVVATLDGDLQNDPADLPAMVERLMAEDLDLLCGRRVARQDKVLLRKVPSWLANRIIGHVTGVKISDYGCSLKVYRGDVIRRVKLVGEMHRFIPVWVAKITSPDRIAEMDVRHHARQFGNSKYGISRTFRVLLDLLTVLFFLKYRDRPGHFFGSVGLLIGAIGGAMLSIVGVAKVIGGEDVGDRPMLMIGSFAFFTAVQLIALGIVAEIVARIYRELPTENGQHVGQSYCNQDECSRQAADDDFEQPALRVAG